MPVRVNANNDEEAEEKAKKMALETMTDREVMKKSEPAWEYGVEAWDTTF